jgi:hypothetical protein
MSKVIETTAPISIDLLKEYFMDNSISFLINYDESEIKGEQLLTFISNIDIPIDIKFSNDTVHELLDAYLKTTNVVNIPSLERLVLATLLHMIGIDKKDHYQILVDKHIDSLSNWLDKIESMAIYNIYTIESAREELEEIFELDETKDLTGVNFINLFKYENWYLLTTKIRKQPVLYKKYFNDYIFKGKNLFHYWANKNNLLFLSTSMLTQKDFDINGFLKAVQSYDT